MTTIAGKDAALEDTLSRFKDIAKQLDLTFVEEQWLNPLPDLWSVHLSIADCPTIYSNGKGSSHDAALASAYGEMFERIATHMSFADFFLGEKNANADFVHFPDEKWTTIGDDDDDDIAGQLPNDILNVKLRDFYFNKVEDGALRRSNLIDVQSSNFERGFCSLPFTNTRNGEVVYFPIDILDNLYGSNGMSAGNTEYEALVQGLSEIIERYVKGRIISEGLSLPQIPERLIKKYPKSYNTLQALQSDELKVICYDASLGGKFPVICVVLFNQSNGTCVASFGSHPIFEAALDRTLTELMQGRTFSDLDGFDEPSFDLDSAADPSNIESHFVDSTGILPMQMFKKQPNFKFVAWDFDGSTQDQYNALRYIVDKLGFEIYVRSYLNLGVHVYRIIVPGMSEIYPVDDLLYANTNANIAYQESFLSLPGTNEDIETYDDYLQELENDNLEDDVLVSDMLGLLPDSDSPWKTLRLGELKCLIALAAQDWQAASRYAQWTILFNETIFDLPRLNFYKCLHQCLECLNSDNSIEDYQESLSLLFGQDTYEKVRKHILIESKFNDLVASDLNLNNFKQHQNLIEVFQKVKKAQISLPQ